MSKSIAGAVFEAAAILRRAGIAEAQRDARSLLSYAIGRNPSYTFTHGDDLLTKEEAAKFCAFIAQRAAREPLQYITGHQEFFKLDFEVTPDVLIPRPETELIVEGALELLKDVSAPLFADIGTGSGCIAISLLHELPTARAIATDISSAALALAQKNAQRHGVSDRLRLVESDCFSGVDSSEPFSLIASNPPYVADRELESLPPEVRNHEPHSALVCGPDGLAVIHRLLIQAPEFLCANGHFLFEMGFGQSENIKQLIDPQTWDLREIRQDLQDIPRTVVLKRK